MVLDKAMRPCKEYSTLHLRFAIRATQAAVVLFVFLCVGTSVAQEYDISLSLRYPAGDKTSLLPTSLYVDSHTGDIYITDASTSRIAIYDSQRRYSFEFSTRDRVSNPQQVAVDSTGRVYVLGDTREHTLAAFDYNGDFLKYLDLEANGERIAPTGIAIDRTGSLYALCVEPLRVYVYDMNGAPLRNFPILTEAGEETRNTPFIGNFSIHANEMLVTLPIIGQAARVGFDGKLIRIFGVAGGGVTELSFPIACCVNAAGEYIVLDKHRHLLQYFNADGQYVREVGGAGLIEGWFFHPTSLVCCGDGTLLVGQTYQNRIQSVVFRNAPVVSGS